MTNIESNRPIVYLDNAATTRPMKFYLDSNFIEEFENWGNPSSKHCVGNKAAKAVENARQIIADFIGAESSEIIFTSGGTESINMGLKGIAPYLKERELTTIITSQIEHHAVLNVCKELEQDGFEIIYMPINSDGQIDIEELDKTMNGVKDKLGLVCIMTVNNEIGSRQLIDDIGALCRDYGAYFMTDAVQAFGHIPLNVEESNIDLMAASGHKIHAYKGTGFLYVRKGIELQPLITGGGQEKNLRAGTENVPGIVILGKAVLSILENFEDIIERDEILHKYFLKLLDSYGVEYFVNAEGAVPHIISLTLPGCESEAMVMMLNERGVCVSAGSACTAGSLEPSHVLKALGLSDKDAACTIRVSMGSFTTTSDLKTAAEEIFNCSKLLKEMNEIE